MAQSQMSEEQLEALQERIKSMSPQELKEFQKKQCIFCQIVLGKIQAKKIYEDDKVLAILDINPANPGHILLLPKEHYSIMPQVPEDEISQIFIVAKHLSNSMLRSIEAQGTNIIIANGIAAGQRAQHFMLHLIPRAENDGISFTLPQKPLSQGVIEQAGDKLIAAFGGKIIKEEKTKPLELPKKHGHKEASEDKHEEAKQKEHHEHKDEDKEHGHKDGHSHSKETKQDEKKTEHKDLHSDKKEPGIDLDDIARLLGAK